MYIAPRNAFDLVIKCPKFWAKMMMPNKHEFAIFRTFEPNVEPHAHTLYIRYRYMWLVVCCMLYAFFFFPPDVSGWIQKKTGWSFPPKSTPRGNTVFIYRDIYVSSSLLRYYAYVHIHVSSVLVYTWMNIQYIFVNMYVIIIYFSSLTWKQHWYCPRQCTYVRSL